MLIYLNSGEWSISIALEICFKDHLIEHPCSHYPNPLLYGLRQYRSSVTDIAPIAVVESAILKHKSYLFTKSEFLFFLISFFFFVSLNNQIVSILMTKALKVTMLLDGIMHWPRQWVYLFTSISFHKLCLEINWAVITTIFIKNKKSRKDNRNQRF